MTRESVEIFSEAWKNALDIQNGKLESAEEKIRFEDLKELIKGAAGAKSEKHIYATKICDGEKRILSVAMRIGIAVAVIEESKSKFTRQQLMNGSKGKYPSICMEVLTSDKSAPDEISKNTRIAIQNIVNYFNENIDIGNESEITVDSFLDPKLTHRAAAYDFYTWLKTGTPICSNGLVFLKRLKGLTFFDAENEKGRKSNIDSILSVLEDPEKVVHSVYDRESPNATMALANHLLSNRRDDLLARAKCNERLNDQPQPDEADNGVYREVASSERVLFVPLNLIGGEFTPNEADIDEDAEPTSPEQLTPLTDYPMLVSILKAYYDGVPLEQARKIESDRELDHAILYLKRCVIERPALFVFTGYSEEISGLSKVEALIRDEPLNLLLRKLVNPIVDYKKQPQKYRSKFLVFGTSDFPFARAHKKSSIKLDRVMGKRLGIVAEKHEKNTHFRHLFSDFETTKVINEQLEEYVTDSWLGLRDVVCKVCEINENTIDKVVRADEEDQTDKAEEEKIDAETQTVINAVIDHNTSHEDLFRLLFNRLTKREKIALFFLSLTFTGLRGDTLVSLVTRFEDAIDILFKANESPHASMHDTSEDGSEEEKQKLAKAYRDELTALPKKLRGIVRTYTTTEDERVEDYSNKIHTLITPYVRERLIVYLTGSRILHGDSRTNKKEVIFGAQQTALAHRLIAEEALQQYQSQFISHPPKKLRDHRLLFESMVHAFCSLPLSAEIHEPFLVDLSFQLPSGGRALFNRLIGYYYYRVLEGGPGLWNLSRRWGADELKAEILRFALTAPWNDEDLIGIAHPFVRPNDGLFEGTKLKMGLPLAREVYRDPANSLRLCSVVALSNLARAYFQMDEHDYSLSGSESALNLIPREYYERFNKNKPDEKTAEDEPASAKLALNDSENPKNDNNEPAAAALTQTGNAERFGDLGRTIDHMMIATKFRKSSQNIEQLEDVRDLFHKEVFDDRWVRLGILAHLDPNCQEGHMLPAYKQQGFAEYWNISEDLQVELAKSSSIQMERIRAHWNLRVAKLPRSASDSFLIKIADVLSETEYKRKLEHPNPENEILGTSESFRQLAEWYWLQSENARPVQTSRRINKENRKKHIELLSCSFVFSIVSLKIKEFYFNDYPLSDMPFPNPNAGFIFVRSAIRMRELVLSSKEKAHCGYEDQLPDHTIYAPLALRTISEIRRASQYFPRHLVVSLLLEGIAERSLSDNYPKALSLFKSAEEVLATMTDRAETRKVLLMEKCKTLSRIKDHPENIYDKDFPYAARHKEIILDELERLVNLKDAANTDDLNDWQRAVKRLINESLK